ncbi:Zinc-specific metallo-regulatory protein [Neomoorella glycerini]|uniref:Zinc-specific metallo-regulatory protein n=1 Tax=Neomoorella glycerini TaxID=55779 RepID=A0A6I5ZUZ2_9FIRM|nr:Fur family transcriptional regulator [Moorella glycerini]QGP93902.1 Zinc-specific metallo-regulatory protein [Moorella glycerini]
MEIEELLKQNELKVTPQRKAILAVLKNTHSFISAQGLFQEVIKILPGTNFSTVYRNLDVLLEKGLLCRVPSDSGADLYELRREEGHHHHAVCKTCGASIAVDFCPMESLAKELGRKGFLPTGHCFEVYGLCSRCRKGKQ